MPANIAVESARLLDVSTDLNLETSVVFNPDGSTFVDADLIETLGAPTTGDGSTILGDFDGIAPLNALDDFSTTTAETVADLHTHPPAVAAFLPFANEFFNPNPLPPQNILEDRFPDVETLDIFTGVGAFGDTVADVFSLLVDEATFFGSG